MKASLMESMKTVFPLTFGSMTLSDWERLAAKGLLPEESRALPDLLEKEIPTEGLPVWLADLARLEWAAFSAAATTVNMPDDDGKNLLNPSIRFIQTPWDEQILAIFAGTSEEMAAQPGPAEERAPVLVWKEPAAGRVEARKARPEDLLVLKMVTEGIDAKAVAVEGSVPVVFVKDAFDRAVAAGLVLKRPSRIRRPEGWAVEKPDGDESFLQSAFFSLQWHITQVCDLHCSHCYDRSDRGFVPLDEAYRILEQLERFCDERNVRGAISLSGGNPLLHPHFTEIYRRAWEHGFGVSILGNPASRRQIDAIVAIQKPDSFQVSLEGLREANDAVRGHGHFDRTLNFLDLLRELGVYSMVMLTLTDRNIDEVLPLARLLEGRTDVFHFNRLSTVGEGAKMSLPSRDRFISFLDEYLAATAEISVLGLKENLFNVYLQAMGEPLFGGCAGFGCSAAFNFVALLPDGEVHACRKFPSPIGNFRSQSLDEIYDSGAAEAYRMRPAACRSCSLCRVCGGCLAAIHSLGSVDGRDPYCFGPSTCQ
jgi:selenobiotic family peptide radical SAM maturase